LYALCFQKYNGSSIIKLLNIDTPLSIGILGILSSMYLEVHIVKPITSKSDKPEIFVVCKNFLHKNSNLFCKNFMNIINNLTKNHCIDNQNDILQTGAINLQLMNRINEISIIFYQRRLEYIHTILNTSLLQTIVNENNTKVNAIMKNNIHKCLEWTSKYYKPIIFSSEIYTIVLRHLYNRINI
jgi:DNA-binding transcriptional regulator GbsR (MarR family)